MSKKIYGYMRVSTREQNEERQRIAMLEYGVPEENLYLDKQSGKDFERPGYQMLLGKLNNGDTLVIKSIDRLGRNYDEILEQWRFLTNREGGMDYRTGYADAGHRRGARPFEPPDFRNHVTGAFVCGPARAGFYQATAERGNRGGKTARRPFRTESHPHPGEFRGSAKTMGMRRDFSYGGGKTLGSVP